MAICKTLIVRAYLLDGGPMVRVPCMGADVIMTEHELEEKLAAIDMKGTLHAIHGKHRNRMYVKMDQSELAKSCIEQAGFELFEWSY